MQNKEDILVFVLGFGSNCGVLEPEWLREEVVRVSNSILSKYD